MILAHEQDNLERYLSLKVQMVQAILICTSVYLFTASFV